MSENRVPAVSNGRWENVSSLVLGRPVRFPLRYSERVLALVGLDFLALNGALLWGFWLSWEGLHVGEAVLQAAFPFLLGNLLWFIPALAFDLFDPRKANRYLSTLPAFLKAMACTTGFFLLVRQPLPELPAPFSDGLVLFPLAGLSILALRGVYILVLTHPIFTQRLFIVGTGPRGRLIAETVRPAAQDLFPVVGMIDESEAGREEVDSVKPPFDILGDRQELRTLIEKHQVNALILAPEGHLDGEFMGILMDCLELGVEIIPMPLLYEWITGRVPLDQMGGNFYTSMPIDHPGTSLFNRVAKRLMDILLACAGLLFLLPLTPLIAAGIYLESPGPVFYTQERVGRRGRRFRAYKFRSMITDAEKAGAVWAQKNDCRVTRVGRLLRKTHVDEFPQFFNILKGEMSAVGPRPERPEFVEELAREIPFFRVRHAVKPGMAGWGLVNQGYGASQEDARRKLEYDLYYIKYQSLWFDLGILIKTVIDTLTCRGRA